MEYRDTSPLEWVRDNQRVVLYLSSFLAVVFAQTALYWWGMATLEGRPRSIQQSFGVIVQSLTTTGYGQDAPWTTPGMQALMIVAQFTGIAYIFIAVPLFVGPWIRNALTDPTVPEALEDAGDHVVICGYSSLCSSLVEDLEARDCPYVIVERDEEQAQDLFEDGLSVVHGDLADDETLGDVTVTEAKAVVIGTRQEDAIGTILSLEEYNPNLQIVCLIDAPEQSRYLRFAGATEVLSPKHRLGKSLADKAQNVVSSELEAIEDLDVDIELAEFPVANDSPLHGRRLTDLEELDRIGATLIGVWLRGEFTTTPSPDEFVDENTVLVLAGTESQLERVESITESGGRSPTAGPVIVAGHGVVGMTAQGVLRKAGQETTVVDTEDHDGVDVVGDATNGATLADAGIDRADTLILALPDDEDAILATLVAREENPDVEIVVAANDPGSSSKLYSAGADYVLPLPKVAGRMAMLELFDEDVMTLREQIRVARTEAPALEGAHPADDDIRRETDSVIVGVKRNGDVVTEFDEEFRIGGDDEVLVAGTDRGVSQFESQFAE